MRGGASETVGPFKLTTARWPYLLSTWQVALARLKLHLNLCYRHDSFRGGIAVRIRG